MPPCPYCNEDRPDESFEVCRIINGKAYRRRKCQVCKRITTNERIQRTASGSASSSKG